MKTIKSKLLALFAAVIVFTIILTISVAYRYNHYITQSETVNKEIGEIQDLSNQIKMDFLLQSKAWKNILIRGYNNDKYSSYVKEFKSLATSIDAQVQHLDGLTEKYGELNNIAKMFGQASATMAARYLEALPVYKLAEHRPHITADKYVRGVNKEAISLIENLQNAAITLKNQTLINMAQQLQQVQMLILAFGVGTIALISYLFLYTIRKGIFLPLRDATILMQNIAEGERDLTLRMDDSRQDEISALSGWYNKFLDNVHQLMGQITMTANNLSSASNVTARITDDTTQAIRKQQVSIADVSKTMNDMADIVEHIAVKADKASSAADMANKEAENGKRVVFETSNSMKLLSQETMQAEQVIKKLADQSHSIESIVKTINDISDQTNLLALNAAIEAARAGDRGRGFAVVASEVRNLAGKTQLATQEIQAMIKGIQTETKHAVETMVRGRVQAEATASLSEQAGDVLEKITASVTNIHQMNTDIADTSKQQSLVAKEINQRVIAINQSVEDTLNNSQRSTSDNGDLAQISLLLHKLISQFKVENHVEERTIVGKKNNVTALDDHRNVAIGNLETVANTGNIVEIFN